MQGCRFDRFFVILPIFLSNCRTFNGKSAKSTNVFLYETSAKAVLRLRLCQSHQESGLTSVQSNFKIQLFRNRRRELPKHKSLSLAVTLARLTKKNAQN